MTQYFVHTWDAELQDFTPQEGVKAGPYTKWGLRNALRALRAMGWVEDHSYYVKSVEVAEPKKKRRRKQKELFA